MDFNIKHYPPTVTQPNTHTAVWSQRGDSPSAYLCLSLPLQLEKMLKYFPAPKKLIAATECKDGL